MRIFVEILYKQIDLPYKLFDQTEALKLFNRFIAHSGEKNVNKLFIAGGAARYLYDESIKPDDVDVYYMGSKEEFNQLLFKFSEYLRSNLPVKFKNAFSGYELVRGVPTFKIGDLPIQFITFREITSFDELFEEFDFSCCCFALHGNNLIYTKEAAEAQAKKELYWSEYAKQNPANLDKRFWRAMKYLKKGYKLGEGQGNAFFEMDWPENMNDYVNETIRNTTSGSDQVQVVEQGPQPAQLWQSVGLSTSTNTVRAMNYSTISEDNQYDTI